MLISWAICASLLPALALASGSKRCSAQHSSSVLDSLKCYNDYSSHIRCSWRESAQTHSQGPLSLFHLDKEENIESRCVPSGRPAHCQYDTSLFAIAIQDHFFFKTPHSPSLSRALAVSQLVRVRPPHSLSQRATEGGDMVLHWKSSYPPSSPLYPTLNYQVNYRRTGQDWMVVEVSEEELVIKSDSLVPGCGYEARVRGRGGAGLWSGWSPLVKWKTEEESVPGPYNLQCEFDGEATMTCSWELKADLAQFVTYHLSYRTDPTATAQWCCSDAPHSADSSLSVLRLSCSFSVSQPEQLLVELTPSYNTKMIRSRQHIRLNPPDPVKVQEKGGDWVLSWTAPSVSKFTISYEVRYWSSETEEVRFNVSQGVQSYRLLTSSLLPSVDYTAQVRTLVPQIGLYSGAPSDWTKHVTWKTHPAPWALSHLLLLVTGVSLAVLLLLLACRRWVKVWKMPFPSPIKSKVLEEVRKQLNNSLAYQKEVERADISEVEVLKKVQASEHSPDASEDSIQRLWLTTTKEDGLYQQVSGQGSRVASNPSLRGPGFESQSEGSVSGPSVQDSTSSLPSSPETPLLCGTEYVGLPPAKMGEPRVVSPARLMGELEVKDACFYNGCPLLRPAESGIELPSLDLDPNAYMPIPSKIYSVSTQQNPGFCPLPDLGMTKMGIVPPSVPPAWCRSAVLAGDSEIRLAAIEEDYIYVKLSQV